MKYVYGIFTMLLTRVKTSRTHFSNSRAVTAVRYFSKLLIYVRSKVVNYVEVVNIAKKYI